MNLVRSSLRSLWANTADLAPEGVGVPDTEVALASVVKMGSTRLFSAAREKTG